MKSWLLCSFTLLSPLAASAGDPPPSTVPSSGPAEIRRGVPMGQNREERQRQFYERIIQKIDPSMRGDVARLPQYLDLFQRELVKDTRGLAFSATVDGDGRIVGFAEFPEMRQSLDEFLQHLGLLKVENQLELLPAPQLGESTLGVITAKQCFIYDKADAPREQLTECTAGDTIYLLKEQSGHLLCHAPSGYVGYVASENVRRVSPKMIETEPSKTSPLIEQMIDTAMKFIGTKYVWGGTTSAGIDCSGLIYTAFKTHGINMPRDADQQSAAGRLVATRWHRTNLRRGDLLYFLGRRGSIHHTGIYLGENKFLEATEPAVTISSFDPAEANYSEKRDKSFCFAKRIFD